MDFLYIPTKEPCLPVEVMAERGVETLSYGPMKPVGLEKDGGKRPFAVVQLRQDDASASMYNIVGFQTHLTWGEQKRIIQMIPGLENVPCWINKPNVQWPDEMDQTKLKKWIVDMYKKYELDNSEYQEYKEKLSGRTVA